jgi:hypothetical protein
MMGILSGAARLMVDVRQTGSGLRLMRHYEGREPAELLPEALPDVPVTFETNKDYVRQVLASQIDLRTDGLTYVPLDELPDGHRYFEYQERVNASGNPSELVIDQNRAKNGHEYRDQTEGDHPVAELSEVGANR